jgi:arylsulfatase A-like enzyme/Flp pilus assembly protein TadD
MKRHRIAVAAAVSAIAAGVLLGRYLPRHGGRERPANVLLLTLDTTRADHLGCYGYAAALTPSLDALAAGGTMFDQAFSNVPMTLPSHTTMLTGLLPPEHGVRVNGEQRLDLPTPTLAEVLRSRGYQTGAFIAAVVLDSANGLNRGFDVYHDQVEEVYKQRAYEPLSAYRPGDAVADDALAWLQQRDKGRPFFCWVHLFDPHEPYYAHKELAGTRFADQASYDGEVAFMDLQVGRLMQFLKQEGLLNDTLVVAVGDHGEGLGDHGEEGHGYMLYATTLRVPWVFWLPGRIQAGTRVGATVSLVDLFATVLEVLGGEVEDRSGRSLAPALFGRQIESVPSYGETQLPFSAFNWSPLWSLTTPEWKYVRSARLHLYDRDVDEKELTNLAAGRLEKVDELEKQLKGIEGEMVVHDAAIVELTAETIKRLEALGYIAGGRKLLNAEGVDFAALHDIEDMQPVMRAIPRLRALGRNDQTSEELIAGLREIVRLSPESPSFHGRLANALIKAGRTQEGLVEALEYLRLKPDDHEICQTVATTYVYHGNNPEAVVYFWKAIRLKPDFDLAHEELAKLLRRYGDEEGAARHSSERRGSLGESEEPYESGVVLAGEGRFDQAVAEFKKALELAPEDPLIHAGLAHALEQKGDLADAARYCREALRLDPDNPRRLYDLGTVLGKQGNYEEAAEYLAKFTALNPEDVPALTNLGLVLARQNKLDEAMLHLSEAVRLRPEDGQVHLTMGGVLEENGRMKEAVAQYDQAVRLNPKRPDWANHLARILASNMDDEVRDGAEAVRLAESACAGAGRANPVFLDTLAAAYAEMGRFDEASATTREALTEAQKAQNQQLAGEIQGRMKLYQSGQPYRSRPQPSTSPSQQ